jgi:hypothetical protein
MREIRLHDTLNLQYSLDWRWSIHDIITSMILHKHSNQFIQIGGRVQNRPYYITFSYFYEPRVISRNAPTPHPWSHRIRLQFLDGTCYGPSQTQPWFVKEQRTLYGWRPTFWGLVHCICIVAPQIPTILFENFCRTWFPPLQVNWDQCHQSCDSPPGDKGSMTGNQNTENKNLAMIKLVENLWKTQKSASSSKMNVNSYPMQVSNKVSFVLIWSLPLPWFFNTLNKYIRNFRERAWAHISSLKGNKYIHNFENGVPQEKNSFENTPFSNK